MLDISSSIHQLRRNKNIFNYLFLDYDVQLNYGQVIATSSILHFEYKIYVHFF